MRENETERLSNETGGQGESKLRLESAMVIDFECLNFVQTK